MAEPVLATTRLSGAPDSPRLLVVGPSLGTSVLQLWGSCMAHLQGYEVIGWDLPGHGRSPATTTPFSVTDLATAVRALVATFAGPARPASYAGVSLGGAVGFQLALDPAPLGRVTVVASSARIGTPAGWADRAALVRRAGTSVLVDGAVQRWFAPGFVQAQPQTTEALLAGLAETDAESYALACEALAGFDLRAHLPAIDVPFLVVAGEHDLVVPPAQAADDVAALPAGRLVVLDGCAHLPPAEDPAALASALIQFYGEEAA